MSEPSPVYNFPSVKRKEKKKKRSKMEDANKSYNKKEKMLYRPSYHMYMEGAHDKDEA
jgi:hypothetical protein